MERRGLLVLMSPALVEKARRDERVLRAHTMRRVERPRRKCEPDCSCGRHRKTTA